MVHDVITSSTGKPEIIMSDEIYQALLDLRKFMFQSVYTNPVAKGEEVKAKRMLEMLYEFYSDHLDAIPERYSSAAINGTEKKDRVLADYISGMTDEYAITKFNECFMPKAWEVDGF